MSPDALAWPRPPHGFARKLRHFDASVGAIGCARRPVVRFRPQAGGTVDVDPVGARGPPLRPWWSRPGPPCSIGGSPARQRRVSAGWPRDVAERAPRFFAVSARSHPRSARVVRLRGRAAPARAQRRQALLLLQDGGARRGVSERRHWRGVAPDGGAAAPRERATGLSRRSARHPVWRRLPRGQPTAHWRR